MTWKSIDEKKRNLHRLSCTAVLSLVLGLTAAWAVVSDIIKEER